MSWLRLDGMTFSAAVCSEANPTGAGSLVSDLSHINMDRILWIEHAPARNRLSLQLDPDRWLVLGFRDGSDLSATMAQVEACS